MTEKAREFAYSRGDFNFLRRIANERTGIVVGDDKFDMFYARLSRRVRKLGLNGFREYCELVQWDQDGAEGMGEIQASGARTIAQDEKSSVVWGMPGEVVKRDFADEILSLGKIAGRLVELVEN